MVTFIAYAFYSFNEKKNHAAKVEEEEEKTEKLTRNDKQAFKSTETKPDFHQYQIENSDYVRIGMLYVKECFPNCRHTQKHEQFGNVLYHIRSPYFTQNSI